mgnify:CR=1 FL=1
MSLALISGRYRLDLQATGISSALLKTPQREEISTVVKFSLNKGVRERKERKISIFFIGRIG